MQFETLPPGLSALSQKFLEKLDREYGKFYSSLSEDLSDRVMESTLTYPILHLTAKAIAFAQQFSDNEELAESLTDVFIKNMRFLIKHYRDENIRLAKENGTNQ